MSMLIPGAIANSLELLEILVKHLQDISDN